MSYKQELLEKLKENILTIKFTKKDGSDRIMQCTLLENYLPKKTHESKKRNYNENIVSVWDVEKNGWRSITIESIINTKVL